MESVSEHENFSTIETDELAALLETSPNNVKLVNATWYFGEGKPNPVLQYEDAHIKGDNAYFDISEVADKTSGFLCTLLERDAFIGHMKRLGIKTTHTVVIYETERIYAGTRAAWVLRIFGHPDVRILNGCLKKWIDEGRPTESGPVIDANDESDEGYEYQERNEKMHDTLRSTLRKAYDVVNQVGGYKEFELIDVRAEASVLKGSIPGFLHSFCEKYLTDNNTRFKTKQEILDQFKEDGIDISKAMTFSCGAGITACIEEAAAALVGAKDISVYDGSYQQISKHGIPDLTKTDWEDHYDFEHVPI